VNIICTKNQGDSLVPKWECGPISTV